MKLFFYFLKNLIAVGYEVLDLTSRNINLKIVSTHFRTKALRSPVQFDMSVHTKMFKVIRKKKEY